MAIITRNVPLYSSGLKATAQRFTFPPIAKLRFDDQPCTLAEANAHLAMLAPDGIVVLAPRERGPMGGWGNLAFTHDQVTSGLAAYRTLHIAHRAQEN